jgi:hypothetical protein
MEDNMKYKAGFFNLLMITLMICLLPASGICDMQSLDDAEMHDIYAEGFSEFKIDIDSSDNATMRLWLNINTAQYTTFDTLKLGYHEEYNYKDPNPGFGWDHDWVGVTKNGTYYPARIGAGIDADDNFITRGFYFEADFENFGDDMNRRLKSVTYGFDYVEGEIYADFVSYTGTIRDPSNAALVSGHNLNLGPGTITAYGENPLDPGPVPDPVTYPRSSLELTLSIDNPYIGYWMNFNNSRFTPD